MAFSKETKNSSEFTNENNLAVVPAGKFGIAKFGKSKFGTASTQNVQVYSKETKNSSSIDKETKN